MRVHVLKCFWKGFLVNERIWGLMERQKQDTQKWNLFWTNFGTPNLSQCLFVFDFVNSVDAFTKPTCLRPCLISCLLSCACEVTVLASWTCEFQLPCLWIQKNYCNCQWLMLPTKLTDCVKNLAVPWLKWLKEFGQTQCQNLDTNWVITAVMMTGHGAPVDMFESQLDESMVCMEYCLLKKPDELPKAKNFMNLWPGQYGRVLACDDIFMAKFSQGGGSACKYQYMERKEWKGKPLLVYAHCQNRFPYVGVLIHEFRPKIVVEQGICTRDDGLVHAVSWRYSSSGEHICTKFFYANVSCKRFDNFSLLKFKVFLVTCPMSQLGK